MIVGAPMSGILKKFCFFFFSCFQFLGNYIYFISCILLWGLTRQFTDGADQSGRTKWADRNQVAKLSWCGMHSPGSSNSCAFLEDGSVKTTTDWTIMIEKRLIKLHRRFRTGTSRKPSECFMWVTRTYCKNGCKSASVNKTFQPHLAFYCSHSA